MKTLCSLLIFFCTPRPLHVYLVLLMTQPCLICLAVSSDALCAEHGLHQWQILSLDRLRFLTST